MPRCPVCQETLPGDEFPMLQGRGRRSNICELCLLKSQLAKIENMIVVVDRRRTERQARHFAACREHRQRWDPGGE